MKGILLIVIFHTSSILYADIEDNRPEDPLANMMESHQSEKEKTEFKRHIYLPAIYYTPETSAAGGVIDILNFWKEKQGKLAHLQSLFVYTLKKQSIVRLVPRLYFFNAKTEVGGYFYGKIYPDQFYGLDTHFKKPETFTENSLKFQGYIVQNVFSHIFVRVALHYDSIQTRNYKEDTNLAHYIEENSFKDVRVGAYSLGLEWDNRDYPQSPLSGELVQIISTSYKMKRRNWNKFEINLRKYILLPYELVLAQQALWNIIDSSEIPLPYFASVGGSERMRGYYYGEYRSTHLGMYQMELRGTIHSDWGWQVFGNLAKVSKEMSQLSSVKTLFSGGFGINYILDRDSRTKIKVDFALSPENYGVYFLMGEAF